MSQDTQATLQRIQAAQVDPSAFEPLYLDYADAVYRYLLSRSGEVGVAEELTAQTFLSAIEALPHYRHRGQFAAWLFTIARNKAADYFRRSRVEAPLEQVENLAADFDLAGHNLQAERLHSLRALIADLPEDERELLRLRYLAELPFKEMGVLLDRNEDAVKKALYRLQDRLQQALEDRDE